MNTFETGIAKKQLHIGSINPNLLEWISKCTFALGLFIELTLVILDKSEYIIQYEGQWFRLTFVLFGISLITTKHSMKEWIGLFFFLIVGFVSYRHTGRNEIIRFVTFIWACQGKDMQRVLKLSFWYTAMGCMGIALLSITGIFGAISQTDVFRVEEEVRYCFGMGHPNSFHCMFFALSVLGIYCYYSKIHIKGYIILTLAHLLVYYFTNSRTGLIVSLFSVALAMVLQSCKALQKGRCIYYIGMIVFLCCVGFSIFCAKYSVMNPLLSRLDRILTGRIIGLMDSNNWEGMLHTWSLWSVKRNNYYFDMGIVRIFYWYGIIPGMIYILVQLQLLWTAMKKSDYMLLTVIISITVYSVIEAHFVSPFLGRNYILFFFGLYLANLLGEKADIKSRYWNEK